MELYVKHSLPADGYLYLNPDRPGQNVGSNLDLNCLTLMIFLNVFFEKLILKMSRARQKSMQELPSVQKVNEASGLQIRVRN